MSQLQLAGVVVYFVDEADVAGQLALHTHELLVVALSHYFRLIAIFVGYCHLRVQLTVPAQGKHAYGLLV